MLTNLAVRDIETLVHPYTNLATHRETGPLVLESGKGIYVYDTTGSYSLVWYLGILLGLASAAVHLPIRERSAPRFQPAAA